MVGVTFHPCNHPIAELDTSLLPKIFFFLCSSCPLARHHDTTHNHTPTVPHFVRRGRHRPPWGRETWRLLADSTLQVNLWLSRREPAAARGRWAACTSGLVGTSASPLLTGRPEFSNLGTALRPCRCDVLDGHPKMLWIARRSGTLGGHLTHDRCFHERRCRTGARPCLARKELIDLAGAWTCGALRLRPLDRVG